MTKDTTKRVKELMRELRLDINDGVLLNSLCIFYLRARQDQADDSHKATERIIKEHYKNKNENICAKAEREAIENNQYERA